MSENIQIVPEKIHIRSIKLLGGSIKSDPEVDAQKIDSFDVKYAISEEFNLNEKTFRFVLSILIDALDKKDKLIGVSAEYNIEYILFVENLDIYLKTVDHDKKSVIFHAVLPNTLVSIVYSTSRGIILSRTQGTSLEGVILPVVDTRSLLKSLEENKDQHTEVSTK
jgi:hypothetical protein